MSEDAAIVLAAGKGTRMRSNLPKVLHQLAGKSMLRRVVDTLAATGFARPTVVIGYGGDLIRERMGDCCQFVDQGEQLGTGHAARVGLEALPSTVERVLLIHGDEPLIDASVYGEMLDVQRRTGAPIVLLTVEVDDTREFGRVVRDQAGHPIGLPQQSDLTPEQEALREVNLGAYVFNAGFLREHLAALQPHAPKGEYYLTDLVALAAGPGRPAAASVTLPNGADVMGVNDLIHLEQATQAVYRRKNRRLMAEGVIIIDSASTFIEDDVEIAEGTTILPFTMIGGETRIGIECLIGPGSTIRSSVIGDRCTVVSSTVSDSVLEDDVRAGPYAHLRRGARIGVGAEVGSHSEIKNTSLGPGSKMHHFGYLGDARIGVNVNIGAGVVTCNYDGISKHETVVEDRAFIGSDTMLRAPVRVGQGGFTGAGSVVTRDVPAGVTVSGVPAREMKQRTGSESEESRQDSEVESRSGS